MSDEVFFFCVFILCVFAAILAVNVGLAGLIAGVICILAMIAAHVILFLKSNRR